MKIGVIPENVIERIVLSLGRVPTPILDTMMAMVRARAVMVATKLGVFEARAAGALGVEEVARRCGTDRRATEKLLDALVASGYLEDLVHHFDDATNRELARCVARSLRPGGVFVIQELIRPQSPRQAGQEGALLDLHFALTSASGTWSSPDMAGWQREAGLLPRKPIRFRSVPGTGQQAAVKPAAGEGRGTGKRQAPNPERPEVC